MTLIISVVSDEFVFQVSDRRVTLLHPDGRTEVRDEPLTKAVVYCDRAVLGFTGYAQVDRMRSDLWIAEQLKDAEDLGDGFDAMRSRLTEIWRRPQYRLGHTVTAAGFKGNGDGSFTPFYAVVTNQLADGEWLTKPSRDFRWYVETAPGGALGVFAAPNWLDKQRLRRLQEEVAAAAAFDVAVELVVEAVREVAAKHAMVGADVLLSVLPRSSVGGPQVMLLTGGPPGETPTFHYIPLNADPTQYGPTFVCRGSVMSDLTVGRVSDADAQRLEAETRRFHEEHRPQRAYLVPVVTRDDPVLGAPSRSPDLEAHVEGASFIYHPTDDVALVLTPTELSGFKELVTIDELRELRTSWGNSFEVEYVSEVTGIGWED